MRKLNNAFRIFLLKQKKIPTKAGYPAESISLNIIIANV